jgi:hypothetical protein
VNLLRDKMQGNENEVTMIADMSVCVYSLTWQTPAERMQCYLNLVEILEHPRIRYGYCCNKHYPLAGYYF